MTRCRFILAALAALVLTTAATSAQAQWRALTKPRLAGAPSGIYYDNGLVLMASMVDSRLLAVRVADGAILPVGNLGEDSTAHSLAYRPPSWLSSPYMAWVDPSKPAIARWRFGWEGLSQTFAAPSSITNIAFDAQGRLRAFTAHPQAGYCALAYATDPHCVSQPAYGPLHGFQYHAPSDKWFAIERGENQIISFHTLGEAPKSFLGNVALPSDMAFSDDGYWLYLLGAGRGSLVRADPITGRYRLVASLDPGSNRLTLGAGADDKAVFAYSPEKHRLQILRPGVEPQYVNFGDLAAPVDVAAGWWKGRDVLFINDLYTLRILNPKSGKLSLFARMPAASGLPPAYLAVADDRIAVSHTKDGEIRVYAIREKKRLLGVIKDLNTPSGLSIQYDGGLLVAERGAGTITRLFGSDWTSRATIAEGLDNPTAIATTDSRETIYVLEAGASRITRITLSNGDTRVVGQLTSRGALAGLAIAKDGRLLTLATERRELLAVNPKNGEVATLASGMPLHVNAAAGIAVLPSGQAVVVDAHDGQVLLVETAQPR